MQLKRRLPLRPRRGSRGTHPARAALQPDFWLDSRRKEWLQRWLLAQASEIVTRSKNTRQHSKQKTNMPERKYFLDGRDVIIISGVCCTGLDAGRRGSSLDLRWFVAIHNVGHGLFRPVHRIRPRNVCVDKKTGTETSQRVNLFASSLHAPSLPP